MIYTRFGNKVIITGARWALEPVRGLRGAQDGKHRMLFVQYTRHDGEEREAMASDFKADGGWKEIAAAIEAVQPDVWEPTIYND